MFFIVFGLAGREKREVRVLIGTLSHPVMIEGKNLVVSSRARKVRFWGNKIQLRQEGTNIIAGERKFGSSIKIFSQGFIAVDGRLYRGCLEVVKDGDKFLIINRLDLDDYLAGVIKNEMNTSWPVEALKAQVVLARTYALSRLENPRSRKFDLYSTVEDQVYQGVGAEDERCWKAIKETQGEVLYFGGKLAEVFYHCCCGGRTEAVEYVWGGEPKLYLRSVKCGYCQECPYYFWRYPSVGVLSPSELAERLGYDGEEVERIIVKQKSPSGRVLMLEVIFRSGYKARISGGDFRLRLGREQVRSTLFQIEKQGDGFVILGSGSGHGVGLCQWGARGMALKGKSYREILNYYFPGTRIKKVY